MQETQNIQSDNTVGAALHTPERLSGETTEAYKARRQASSSASKANSQVGKGGQNTRKALRDAFREKGLMHRIAGAYGKGLRNWITRNNQAILANKGV